MPKDLITPFVAVIIVPFSALMLDYLFRWTPILETMKRAGPDFSIMGLGSVGAIFIDKRATDALTSLTTLPVQLNLFLVALMILVFRQISFKIAEGRVLQDGSQADVSAFRAVSSCAFGLASIILVSAILYVGYSQPGTN
jgi:hypothetical protein